MKAIGENWEDQHGARRLERSREKRALNREIRAEKEERSVVRRSGRIEVECRKQYITIKVNSIKQIRANKSESERRWSPQPWFQLQPRSAERRRRSKTEADEEEGYQL